MERDQHDVALPALPIGVGIAAGKCRSHFFPHSPIFLNKSVMIVYLHDYDSIFISLVLF
jgi:hypothetical protein